MLNLLLEYAEQQDLAAAPGFKRDYVRWLLRFGASGEYVGVTMRDTDDPKKGDLFRLPRLSQPEMKAGGAGTRHFLVDTAAVVVLLGAAEPPDPKLLMKHQYFIGLLRDAAAGVPVLALLADSLTDAQVLQRIHSDLTTRDTPAKATDNVTFYVNGHQPPILTESDAWHDWYADFRTGLSKNTSTRQMISLAGGVPVTPARTHGVVRGLAGVGGIAMGDSLASFKQAAFQHYGLEQSENSAVSAEEAATYRTALDSLIRNRSRSLAGAKVAYWYAGPGATAPSDEDDPVGLYTLPMAPEPSSDTENAEAEEDHTLSPEERAELERQTEAQAGGRVRKLLVAIRKGERPDLVETRFYALSLAANSGRVVVRDWMQGEFTDLAASVLRWVEDLSIVRLDSPQVPDRVPKLETLVTCVLPVCKPGQKYGDWVKPAGKLREPLWRAAVGMKPSQNLDPPPIPEDAISILLPRWRASVLNGEFDEALDGHPLHQGILYARASLIKAHLIRSGVVMEPHLFEDHPEPAYHCGRLLAVLANVQKEALGDVGANVVQRYYARASVAPADAIGPLITLSNRHLDKLEPGLADHLQGQIADVFGKLSEQKLPATLDTVKQSLFAMGFYQQIARMRHERAANAAKKRERDNAAASTSTGGET